MGHSLSQILSPPNLGGPQTLIYTMRSNLGEPLILTRTTILNLGGPQTLIHTLRLNLGEPIVMTQSLRLVLEDPIRIL